MTGVPRNSYTFQCSSASRKFSIRKRRAAYLHNIGFSALQRAENSQYPRTITPITDAKRVSVLFSEPKILNSRWRSLRRRVVTFQCSSASRKFSIVRQRWCTSRRNTFQCSSASRKFSMRQKTTHSGCWRRGFSALQRAENSQLSRLYVSRSQSASFSALQRAENSQSVLVPRPAASVCVSVLFSEPKILNLTPASRSAVLTSRVSVLFSEPKILNACPIRRALEVVAGFSALQRAENSQYGSDASAFARNVTFQCSSASRKFSILRCRSPQRAARMRFQCSSASRKFSMRGTFL